MLLISARRAAAAIGTVCSTASGANEPGLLETLRNITPHLESLANVRTFKRGVYEDTFNAVSSCRSSVNFRLSNGFLTGADIAFTGLYTEPGVEIASGDIRVDREMGIVTAFNVYPTEEPVKITYTSGFVIEPYDANAPEPAHPDINYRVYLDVPDNIASVVATVLSLWSRNGNLSGKGIPKDVRTLIAMNDVLQRMLKQRIYGTYARPRAGMEFSESYRAL